LQHYSQKKQKEAKQAKKKYKSAKKWPIRTDLISWKVNRSR